MEVEAACGALAVKDTLRRIAALGTDGDDPAPKVEALVSSACVGSIGNKHHIASDSRIDARLDGGVLRRNQKVGGVRGGTEQEQSAKNK